MPRMRWRLLPVALGLLITACADDPVDGPTPTLIGPLQDSGSTVTPAPTPESAPEPAPAPGPVDDDAPPVLEDLLGRVRFEFGFTDAAEILEVSSTFEAGDIGLPTEGDTLADGLPIDDLPGGAPSASDRVLVSVEDGNTFVCNSYAATATERGRHLCLVLPLLADGVLPQNQTVVFLFDLGADGRGRGEMEFCTRQVPTEDLIVECAIRAATSPDGFVDVEIDPVVGASARARVLAPGKELIRVDHGVYLGNAERARTEPALPDDVASSERLRRVTETAERVRAVVADDPGRAGRASR